MASSQSEKDFVSTYLTLLSLSDTPNKFPDDFKKDIREVKGLGVKLPNLPVQMKSKTTIDSPISVHTCIFKSIKPPKFNVSLEVKSTETIYQVKSQLSKEIGLGNLEPSNIKLLLKGKVISDASLVHEIASESGEDIKFTAIVSSVEATQTSTPSSQSQSGPPPQSNDESLQLPWADIKGVLESNGIDSSFAIARLQKGWELAK